MQPIVMPHIQNEATKMIEEWKAKGFNGVRFVECRMEPTAWEDWESDGRSRQEYDEFVEGYAIFIAHPDLYSDYEPANRYELNSIDWDGFAKDLEAEMRRRLGDDIEIEHYPNCHEYEIQRATVSA
ncbi:hypothetical protein V7x_28580 [Crateriforma conspicua]|uniref:Uncharacterized protein n=1 Tax=Crateriforma conspicua TaxID=2527996 RepID=A0A5C6FY67_9PLAN|nr:hypothetical protein [Crateriforma conspicua]TWU67284.1 hypothetical protein V7x_28580 [Crateriforma conspicua]